MKTKQIAKQSGISVLIVDDNPVVLRGIVSILAGFPDICLAGTTDAAGALGAMRTTRPNVLIVDVTFRGSLGLETAKACAYDPACRVIVLDLNGEPTYASRAISNGAKGYVSTEPEKNLPDAIRRVHSGKLWVSDEVAQNMIVTLTKHAGAPESEPIDALSDRELEVVEHVGKGLSASELATALGLSIKTVESHKANIKKKLGIAKGSQLTHYCVTWYEQRKTRK